MFQLSISKGGFGPETT